MFCLVNLEENDTMQESNERSQEQMEKKTFEMLKGDFAGFANVRIDKKSRIIFEAD